MVVEAIFKPNLNCIRIKGEWLWGDTSTKSLEIGGWSEAKLKRIKAIKSLEDAWHSIPSPSLKSSNGLEESPDACNKDGKNC